MQRIVTILDTALTVNYNDRPISTQKDLDTYKFQFDDSWQGYVKTAVFYTDPMMVKHLLIPEDGVVTIPWEILTGKPQALYVGVFGAKDSTIKPTTFGAVRLREGSYIDGVAPLPPTPDVYQQIIGAWEDAKVDEEERLANESGRKQSETDRRTTFDALVDEYNGLKAALEKEITDGTASVDALQVLESQYAAKALALEATYAPELNLVKSQLADRATQAALEVEKARINNLATLTAGSTTGDAELIDARVGADGKTYANLGSANRGQFANINGKLVKVANNWESDTLISSLYYSNLKTVNGSPDAHSFYFEPVVGKKYKILVNGLHNRFQVFTANEALTNKDAVQIFKSATNDIVASENYDYEHLSGKYCFVMYAYGMAVDTVTYKVIVDYSEEIKLNGTSLAKKVDLDTSVVNVGNLTAIVDKISKGFKYAKLTNLISNGLFVNTTGWSPTNATVSAVNNIMSIVGNGVGPIASCQNVNLIPLDGVSKHAVYCKVRVTNDVCKSLTVRTLAGYGEIKIPFPVKDKWYEVLWSESLSATGNVYPISVRHEYADTTVENGKVLEVTDIRVIKISSDFGLGINPPTYKLLKMMQFNAHWDGSADVIIDSPSTDNLNNKNNNYLLTERNSYQSVKKPIVSFVNDDGWQDDYNKLVAISEKYQVPFTSALFNGSTMNEWCELYLQNELGWEFASHPRNVALAEILTEEEIELAMVETNEYLTNRGLKYYNLVYPYGSNDERVRRIAKKYYRNATTTDAGINTGVSPSFRLKRWPLGYGSDDNTLATLKSKVDEAVANNGWLIFMLHPQMAIHTDALTATIDSLIAYIKSIGVDILTLNDGYNIHGNALECGDYVGGATGIAISYDGSKNF